jgi:hypothetical protein
MVRDVRATSNIGHRLDSVPHTVEVAATKQAREIVKLKGQELVEIFVGLD